jgi:chromosome segregation ATPase
VELETELHQLQAALFEQEQELQRVQLTRLDADNIAIRLEAAERSAEHEQCKVQELTREISALQDKHESELLAEKHLCKERTTELQRWLESTQARSEQQRANLQSTQSELGRQMQDCARLQQNLNELESISLERGETLDELDALKRELASARTRIAEQELCIEKFQVGHQSMESENCELQHELSSTRSDVGKLELALHQCELQLDELQAACLRFADAERKLRETDEALKATSASLRQCASEKEELLLEVRQLSLLSNELELEQRHSPRVKSRNETEQRAVTDKQLLDQPVRELRDARVRLQAKFEEKVRDIMAAHGELNELLQRHHELEYEAEVQRQRVRALEADGDELRIKAKEQEGVIRELNETVSTLQLHYSRLGSTMAIEEAQVSELQQALRNSLQDARKMAERIDEQSAELSLQQQMNLHLKHSLSECSEKAAQIESMVRQNVFTSSHTSVASML